MKRAAFLALAIGCGASGGGDAQGTTGGDVAESPADTSDPGPGGVSSVAEESLPPASMSVSEGIHVALTGDDTAGDGTAAAPYRSIQHVLDTGVPEGTVILVHEGVYEESVRIRTSHVTLQAAPGESVHIQCPVDTNQDEPVLCLEVDAETEGVTLRGLEVSGGYYAVYLGSQWDYDDTPTDNLTAKNVTIEDCRLHGSGFDVVKLPSGVDGATIRRCEIYASGRGYPEGTALDDMNAEGIDAVNADDLLVQDTWIHDTATSCAYAKGGSQRTVFERIRAERCGGLGLVLGFDSSPEWFDLTVNPEYFESIGGVVRNCVVTDTGQAGIAVYASKDAQILHNTVVRTGKVAHAALYLGIATQDYDEAAGRPANQNPRFVGNVVDQTGVDAGRCVRIQHSVEDSLGVLTSLDGAATFENNVFWGGCTFDDQRPDALLEEEDFAAWQQHGLSTAEVWGDPRLDAQGGLGDGSAAIDVAGQTAGVRYDVGGQERVAPFDAGADER